MKNKRVRKNIVIDEGVFKKAKIKCIEKGITFSSLIEALTFDWVHDTQVNAKMLELTNEEGFD